MFDQAGVDKEALSPSRNGKEEELAAEEAPPPDQPLEAEEAPQQTLPNDEMKASDDAPGACSRESEINDDSESRFPRTLFFFLMSAASWISVC
jgi:hypothetical protein